MEQTTMEFFSHLHTKNFIYPSKISYDFLFWSFTFPQSLCMPVPLSISVSLALYLVYH